jgi:VRR-NUC domain
MRAALVDGKPAMACGNLCGYWELGEATTPAQDATAGTDARKAPATRQWSPERSAPVSGHPGGSNCPLEHDEQKWLFEWIGRNVPSVPELAAIFAIPNAGAGAQKGQAGKMKAEGVRPGVPDVCCAIPSDGYHALYIEMKRLRGGAVSDDQKAWHKRLRDNGCRVEVCRGWIVAARVICDYLGMLPDDRLVVCVANARGVGGLVASD